MFPVHAANVRRAMARITSRLQLPVASVHSRVHSRTLIMSSPKTVWVAGWLPVGLHIAGLHLLFLNAVLDQRRDDMGPGRARTAAQAPQVCPPIPHHRLLPPPVGRRRCRCWCRHSRWVLMLEHVAGAGAGGAGGAAGGAGGAAGGAGAAAVPWWWLDTSISPLPSKCMECPACPACPSFLPSSAHPAPAAHAVDTGRNSRRTTSTTWT